LSKSQYERHVEWQLSAAGVPAWEKEFRFALEQGRQYRWDWAWPAEKVALELDGGRFLGRGGAAGAMSKRAPLGYHGSVEDYRKRNLGNLLGWTILTYNPEQLRTGELVTELMLALEFKRRGSTIDTALWNIRLKRHTEAMAARDAVKRRVRVIRKKARARGASLRAGLTGPVVSTAFASSAPGRPRPPR
jgi:hypothetical protein